MPLYGWYKHWYEYNFEKDKYQKFLKERFYESDIQLHNDFIEYIECNFPVVANKKRDGFLLDSDKIKLIVSNELLEVDIIYNTISEVNKFIETYNLIIKGETKIIMAKMTSNCWRMVREYEIKSKETQEIAKEAQKRYQQTEQKYRETEQKYRETEQKYRETELRFQETERKCFEIEQKHQETKKELFEQANIIFELKKDILKLQDKIHNTKK